MIALLRGTLLEKHPNQAIVDAGGVGYDVTIPVSTFTHLPDAGAEVRLRIHTHVREDALALYGFLTPEEKALFEKLIGVSGIGPTLAVKVLSGVAAPELILAIQRGEVERLVRIPGVGKKTAERMVLELRDKLPAVSGVEPEAPAAALTPVDQDVLSALLNLGCARRRRRRRCGRRRRAARRQRSSNRCSGRRWSWCGKRSRQSPVSSFQLEVCVWLATGDWRRVALSWYITCPTGN
jgi:Holliday junction DNA helicase RuvA